MNYSSFSKKSQSQKLINSFSSFKPKCPLSLFSFFNLKNLAQNLRTKKTTRNLVSYKFFQIYKNMNSVLFNNCNPPFSPKSLLLKDINKTVLERDAYLIRVKTIALKKIVKEFIYRLTFKSDKAEKLNQQDIVIQLKKVLFLSLKYKDGFFFHFQKQDATFSKKFIGIDASYHKLEETLKLLLKDMQHEAKFILRIKISSIFTKYLAKTLLGMSSLKFKKADVNPKSFLLQNYKLFYFDKIKNLRKQSWQEKNFRFSVQNKSFIGLKKNKWINNYLSETRKESSFKNKVRFCSLKINNKERGKNSLFFPHQGIKNYSLKSCLCPSKKWTSFYIQKWFLKFLTNRDSVYFTQNKTIAKIDYSSSNIKKNKIKNKIKYTSDFIRPKTEQTFLNPNTEKANSWSQTKDSIYFKNQSSSFFDLLNLCIQKETKKKRTSLNTLNFRFNNSDTTYIDFFYYKRPGLLIYNKKINGSHHPHYYLINKGAPCFLCVKNTLNLKSYFDTRTNSIKTTLKESNLIMFKNNEKRLNSIFLMPSSMNPILANTLNFLTKNLLNSLIQKENKDFLLKLVLLDQAKNCSEQRMNSHFINFSFLPFLNLFVKNKRENSNNCYFNKLKLNLSTVNGTLILESNKLQNKINNMSHYFILNTSAVNKLYPFSQNRINKEKIYKYLFNNFSYLSFNVGIVKLSKIKRLNFSFYCKESYKFPFWLKKLNSYLFYKIIPFFFFQDSLFLKRFTKSFFLLTKKELLIKSLKQFLKNNKKTYLLNKNIKDQSILYGPSSSINLNPKENLSLFKTLFSSLFFKAPKPFSILSKASNYQFADEFLNVHSNLNILYALQKWVNIYFSLCGIFLEKQKCEIIPCFSPFLINDYFLKFNTIEPSFLLQPSDYIFILFLKFEASCHREKRFRRTSRILFTNIKNPLKINKSLQSAFIKLLKEQPPHNMTRTYFINNKRWSPFLPRFYIFKNNKVKNIKKIVEDFYYLKSKSFANQIMLSKTRTISEDDLKRVFTIKKNLLYKNYGLNFFGFHIFQIFRTKALSQANNKQKYLKEFKTVFRNDKLNYLTTNTFKTLILPSHNNIQNQIEQIRQIIFFSKTKTKLQLINCLAPIIREWCYYYKIVKSQKINLYLDYLTLKTIWRWCCRRHPNKSHQWIKNKYFCQINGQKWVFGEYISTLSAFVCLPNHTDRF